MESHPQFLTYLLSFPFLFGVSVLLGSAGCLRTCSGPSASAPRPGSHSRLLRMHFLKRVFLHLYFHPPWPTSAVVLCLVQSMLALAVKALKVQLPLWVHGGQFTGFSGDTKVQRFSSFCGAWWYVHTIYALSPSLWIGLKVTYDSTSFFPSKPLNPLQTKGLLF